MCQTQGNTWFLGQSWVFFLTTNAHPEYIPDNIIYIYICIYTLWGYPGIYVPNNQVWYPRTNPSMIQTRPSLVPGYLPGYDPNSQGLGPANKPVYYSDNQVSTRVPTLVYPPNNQVWDPRTVISTTRSSTRVTTRVCPKQPDLVPRYPRVNTSKHPTSTRTKYTLELLGKKEKEKRKKKRNKKN